jgi:hypothetical protein
MAATFPKSAAPGALRRWACRLAVPTVAVLLFAALAMLWRWGPPALYFDVLKLFGFEPFRFPFLDIHAVLAAAQCQRLGIDVYLSNPCDALGRVHVYSPLWLALTPSFLDTNSTAAAGLGLDLMFILSLGVILRPATPGEVLILMFIALSPMTIYALERANCDLVVFLLVVGGCALGQARQPWRFGAYALYLFAGLLKYYPLVLLALLLRERRREALIGVGLAAVIVLGLAGFDRAELVKALANIPPLSYFTDSFSARNLPFGIAEAAFGPRVHTAFALAVLSVVAALALVRIRRTMRLLDQAMPELNTLDEPVALEPQCLLVGALLVTACFFAGQNVDYRGIYLLLIMPGLIRLHRLAVDPAGRQFAARMIVAVLFVAWSDPVRRGVHMIADAIPNAQIGLRLELLFWIGCELVWWWLIAGLAAIVLSCASPLPVWPYRRHSPPRRRSAACGRAPLQDPTRDEITPGAQPP